MNEFQHNYQLNKWLRDKGLKISDLDSHPQIDDVILLAQWRDALWADANLSERSFWGTQWDWAYIRKYPLKKKMLTKLEDITTIIGTRQHDKAQQRAQIKSLRKAKQAI